jgi:predicted hydrocarbon binding protein
LSAPDCIGSIGRTSEGSYIIARIYKMKRKEFLKSACTLGMCSCAGASFLSGETFIASSDDTKKEADWRLGFIQKRFAKMIVGMDSTIDQETKTKILENLGRACAKENAASFVKFKGDPESFLEDMKQQWAERTEYDKNTKTMKIIGKKQESCFCPFVDKSMTPKDFCNCSIGFNKEAFETILGKPVDVKIEESILRGGERCSFTITMK